MTVVNIELTGTKDALVARIEKCIDLTEASRIFINSEIIAKVLPPKMTHLIRVHRTADRFEFSIANVLTEYLETKGADQQPVSPL